MGRGANIRVVEVTQRPGRRVLRALALFGMAARRRRRPRGCPGHLVRAAAWIASRLAPGRVVFISGASGSGKSTLLGAVERAAKRRRLDVRRVAPPREGGTVIELVPGSLGTALAALARAGLGDATLLARGVADLSEGERFRLGLAVAWAGAGPGAVIVADEFTSNLDRPTAGCVAAAVPRWAMAARAMVVLASAHDDIGACLEAGVMAECDEDGVTARSAGTVRRFAARGRR